MQTVNFKCGHCGNLMGVSAEYLGQQVRCPHCQQIVVAPPAPALGPMMPHLSSSPEKHFDETTVLPPPADDAASIFAAEGPTDALFDDPKPPPLDFSEVPRDSTLALESPHGPPPVPALESTLAFQPALSTPAAPLTKAPSSPEMPSWMKTPAPVGAASTNGSLTDLPAPPPVQAPRRSSLGLTLFITLVFMPLVLYSILVTIVAILIYINRTPAEQPHDYREYLNDVEGDHPGVKKPKSVSYIRKVDAIDAAQPLTDNRLRIKLGETLTLGDILVKAERVEQGEVKIVAKNGGRPEPREVLILRLHLENVSKNSVFYPMDAYFNRQSDGKVPVPLTVLMAGDDLRFFGGPAPWSKDGTNRYDVLDAHYNTELKPGQEMETFVCTNGPDPRYDSDKLQTKFNALTAYKGKLVWHVQIRRGLTTWKDHDYPTTAVFGVEFTDADVKRAH